MKTKITPAPKLDYDPYEEDCCGARPGETTIVEGDDLKIIIREQKSGIGSSYYIDVDAGKYGKRNGVLVAYVDDDGELHVERGL